MAVDTANKRYSMLGLGLDFMRLRPVPDGSVDTADRLHFLPLYSGIAASAPVGGGTDTRRHMRVGRAIWSAWKLMHKSGEL